ncbi:MAG: hypothetical protein KA436_00530 [Oligoflexales bacterium]|nr:hypothetical protein [Oligoflexales bacterium]
MKTEQELYRRKNDFFIKISSSTRGALVFCLVFSVVVFVLAITMGSGTRVWGAFLFNLMLFFSLALGGVAFGHMQDMIGALWGRPIKRIHESFGAFVPWAALALVLFFLCIKFKLGDAHKVYSWIASPGSLSAFPGKSCWLTPGFMMIRDLGAMAVLVALVLWQRQISTRADFLVLQGREEEAEQSALEATQRLRMCSAPILVVYALCFSLLSFDLTMSLAPTWLSTLWGGWNFAIMMQVLLASTLLAMFALQSSAVGGYFARNNFHDIGKLLFGFTVFFAYLTYAHVLTYWYTNMPEETSYLITRMGAPWLKYVIAAPFISFLFPFILLIPKANKWTSHIAIPVCVVVLAAQWLNSMLVVMPELVNAGEWHGPWLELAISLGFLAAFLLSVFTYAEKTPMLSLADPLLHRSLDERVHH